MPHLLTIPIPKNKSHIFWEHAMKSVFALGGTFALLFFGPMFLAAGSSKTRRNDGLGIEIVGFFLERPMLQAVVCVVVTLIYNGFIFMKNRKVNNVVGISIENENVTLQLNNLFFNRLQYVKIPLKELAIQIVSKSSDINGKTKTICFRDTTKGKAVGYIKADHFVWNRHVKAIRSVLGTLAQKGVEIEKVNKLGPSIMESAFK